VKGSFTAFPVDGAEVCDDVDGGCPDVDAGCVGCPDVGAAVVGAVVSVPLALLLLSARTNLYTAPPATANTTMTARIRSGVRNPRFEPRTGGSSARDGRARLGGGGGSCPGGGAGADGYAWLGGGGGGGGVRGGSGGRRVPRGIVGGGSGGRRVRSGIVGWGGDVGAADGDVGVADGGVGRESVFR